MAGLVAYGSSDEEDEVEVEVTQPPTAPKPLKSPPKATVEAKDAPDTTPKAEPTAQAPPPLAEPSGVIGPMPQQGDANPSFPPLEDAPIDDEEAGLVLPPGSPYSASRALLRNLTLPRINKQFEQFLELKKNGVHFNSKIAQSSALKNPGLMDKLMNFVEIDHKGQYQTTLGPDLWDPAAFPREAYKEGLRQNQVDINQARARKQGAPMEFVAASRGSRETTPVQKATDAQKQTAGAATSIPTKRKTRFDA
ncbi:HCNGP-like protein-domain-containing protein [Apiospora arundinis]